jgi:hypothetical protein
MFNYGNIETDYSGDFSGKEETVLETPGEI